RGNRVLLSGTGAVDVNAKNLAQQRLGVLPVSVAIAPGSSIAQADIKKTVGAEGKLSALVIRERLVDYEQDALAVGISEIRVAGRNQIFGNDCLQLTAGIAGVVEIELVVLREIGMKREAQ